MLNGKNWPMHYNNYLCTFFLSVLIPTFNQALSQDYSNFTNEDKILSKDIRTVQFYRTGTSPQEIFNTSATNLDQQDPLHLRFDMIGEEAKYLYVKILHCNSDWSKSELNAAEYLVDYNEFLIEDYDFSFNTKTPFTHYWFRVPRVKISGNYLVLVYEADNPNELILVQRFFIYENLLQINTNFTFSTNVSARKSYQQLDFDLRYKNYYLQDPQTEIKVTLRQNYRWDNAKTELPPLYVDINDKTLDYRYFDLETAFLGGNEFRSFAFRHLNFTDINLESIETRDRIVKILPGRLRSNRAFVNDVDINGKFFIENSQGGAFDLDGDYFRTIFRFDSEKKYLGRIYVVGALSNWELLPEFEMLYDEEEKHYLTSAILKQGYYNYYFHYVPEINNPVPDINEYYLEGSFFQTENIYEIIVYHRPPGGRADRIVSYLVKKFAN